MHTEPSKHANNPEIQYEKTDAHVRPLYMFLFWISVICVITAIISFGILRGLEKWREAASTRATMAEAQTDQQPPAPRLQTREPLDLAAHRKEDAEVLTTYGIVDREKGVYRIPIDEAMRLTIERGLPTASEAPVSETPGKPTPAKAARP